MILTDSQAIFAEREIQRFDPTLVLLRNDRLKSWVVAQDLRKTNHGSSPWVDTPPGLVGVLGIGDKTYFNYLFETNTPNAQFIVRRLAEDSIHLRVRKDRDGVAHAASERDDLTNLREERAKAEIERELRRAEMVAAFRADLMDKVYHRRKRFLVS